MTNCNILLSRIYLPDEGIVGELIAEGMKFKEKQGGKISVNKLFIKKESIAVDLQDE